MFAPLKNNTLETRPNKYGSTGTSATLLFVGKYTALAGDSAVLVIEENQGEAAGMAVQVFTSDTNTEAAWSTAVGGAPLSQCALADADGVTVTVGSDIGGSGKGVALVIVPPNTQYIAVVNNGGSAEPIRVSWLTGRADFNIVDVIGSL